MAQISLITLLTLFSGLSILAGVGLSIWVNYYNGQENIRQDHRITNLDDYTVSTVEQLELNVSNVNTTCNTRITLVNTTLQNEIDVIYTFLNFTNQTGSNFTLYVINNFVYIDGNITNLYQQDVLINSTFTNITNLINVILTTIQTNITTMNATLTNTDQVLTLQLDILTQNFTNLTMITIVGIETNITNLQNSVNAIILAMAQKIATINGVVAVSTNINLNSGTPASLVINSTGAGNVDLYVTALSSVTAGTGLSATPSNPITSSGTIFIENTTVTPGPYTYGAFTVNQQGQLTAASSGVAPVTSITAGTGLVATPSNPIISTGTINLANTTAVPGNYILASLTVDQQGRLTAVSNGSAPGTGTVTR